MHGPLQVVAYATLSLPWNVLRAVSVFEQSPYKIIRNKIFSEVASTLLVVNSVVNPYIYYLASKDFRMQFRHGFRSLLTMLKVRKHVETDSIFADSLDGGEQEGRRSLSKWLNFIRAGGEAEVRLSEQRKALLDIH